MPQLLTGELLLDPDIYLKAKAFDLDIRFYYGSQAIQPTSPTRTRSLSGD